MRGAFAIILCAGFLAAAPASAADRADALAKFHTFGIISAIGEKIALKNVALMVFGNTDDVLGDDALKIDGDVTTLAARALPSSAVVKTVTANHDAFSTQATGWYKASEVDIESLIAKLNDRESVDAYIVIYPAAIEDLVFQTNQYLRGLGVYRRSGLGSGSVVAYAMYRVAVVDAHTGKTVATEWATNGKTGFFDLKLPYAEVPDSLWSETAAGLGEQQKTDVRAALMALVEPSLAGALTRLGFVPATPP
jgi:hypothetical protein